MCVCQSRRVIQLALTCPRIRCFFSLHALVSYYYVTHHNLSYFQVTAIVMLCHSNVGAATNNFHPKAFTPFQDFSFCLHSSNHGEVFFLLIQTIPKYRVSALSLPYRFLWSLLTTLPDWCSSYHMFCSIPLVPS